MINVEHIPWMDYGVWWQFEFSILNLNGFGNEFMKVLKRKQHVANRKIFVETVIHRIVDGKWTQTRTHWFWGRSWIWIAEWCTRLKRQPILRYKCVCKIGFRLFDHHCHGLDGTVRSKTFAFSHTISGNNVTQTLFKRHVWYIISNLKFHPNDCGASATWMGKIENVLVLEWFLS